MTTTRIKAASERQVRTTASDTRGPVAVKPTEPETFTPPAPNPAHTFFEGWWCHLPEEFKHHAEPYWLARSRQQRWAPYCKSLSQRSRALWPKAEILTWFRYEFGVTYPDAIQRLLDNDFEEMLPTSYRLMNSAQRKVHRAKKKKEAANG